MRRKEKLVTDLKILHDVINKAEVCRLGLVDGDKPYIVPLSFGFDGQYIYFHSAIAGRKVEILLHKNKRVCVEFEQHVELIRNPRACGYGLRFLTVMGDGFAELVTDVAAKKYALNQLMRHYEPAWIDEQFTEPQLDSVLIFKITLEELTGKVSGM
jgi:uncharacterized protein